MSERRIVVVGGGITGLAAAHRVRELARERSLDVSVALLESAPRVGGQIRTEKVDGTLLEGGADSLVLAKPAGVALCERLGLADEIVRPPEGPGRLQILRRGRLVDVPPARLGAILLSPLFSVRGKLALARERFVPARRDDDDESLSAFVTRRFGREALERVAEPILASLFTADADRLSLRAALPRFAEMERRHGSLTRAVAAARARGGGKSGMASLRNGFGTLVDALVARLPRDAVRTGVSVARVTAPPESPRWELSLERSRPVLADAVIFACPSGAAASLLADVDAGLAAELDRLAYAPCATVNLLYDERDVGRPPRSFGFFVPRTERRPLLAVSFVSVKFPERAPRGRLLVRAFLGGALRADVAGRDEGELARLAHAELRPVLRLRGEPALARVARFPDGMPQLEVGFLRRRESIEARAAARPGLVLAGGALGAVGVPDCIASGERAAERAVELVAARVPAPAAASGAASP